MVRRDLRAWVVDGEGSSEAVSIWWVAVLRVLDQDSAKYGGDPRYDSRCIPELKDLRNLVGVLPQITIAIVILNMDTPHPR